MDKGLMVGIAVGKSYILLVGALACEGNFIPVRAFGRFYLIAGIADHACYLEPGGIVQLESHIDHQVGCGHLDLSALVVGSGQRDIRRHAAALRYGNNGLYLVAAFHREAQIEHSARADAVPELERRQVVQFIQVGIVAALAAAYFLVHYHLDLIGIFFHSAELSLNVGGVRGHGKDIIRPRVGHAVLIKGDHHPLPGCGIRHQAIKRTTGSGHYLGTNNVALLDHHGVTTHGGGRHDLAGGSVIIGFELAHNDLVGIGHHWAGDH